jgi:uncharacterized protein with von Willebrand factor type A (vWA) domain
LAFDYVTVEKVAKGPIIVTVDESGSMSGEPVCAAKAFALAMAWVAQYQGRWCALIGYSGNCPGTMIALPPGKWNEAGLADWLEHFYSGGSSRDVPIAELPGFWEALKAPKGKTDLCMITDAIADIPNSMKEDFLAWKKQAKVKATTLLIGDNRYGLKDISDVCEEVHHVSHIGTDEVAIEQCLSI